MTVPPAIPAATLILFREAAGCEPELLMIERAAGMAFAAGALVFPGGRVDPGDRAMAASISDGLLLAGKVAAVRETIEEAGIAVGLQPAPDADALEQLRAGLTNGKAFASLLAEGGFELHPASLAPFARWRPDAPGIRNFDTLFFIAVAPPGAVAMADGGESVRAFWAPARHLLAEAMAGRNRLMFPTRCVLERVAALGSFDAAVADARLYPMDAITPWVEERDGARWLCIPSGRGYPVTDQRIDESDRD